MSGGSHGRCIMKLMELKLQGLLMCIGYFMALFLIKKKKKELYAHRSTVDEFSEHTHITSTLIRN